MIVKYVILSKNLGNKDAELFPHYVTSFNTMDECMEYIRRKYRNAKPCAVSSLEHKGEKCILKFHYLHDKGLYLPKDKYVIKILRIELED